MSFSVADERAMLAAIELAASAIYNTDPNPRVGCVIVRDGEVVGRGAHLRAGTEHAEVHALREAGDKARGATCYVTLEPCNHHGRTPPCSEALIAAGVARVVIAMADTNPQAAGGAERLQAAGIEVETGLLATASRELNIGFHHRCETGRPWVRLKLAGSMDGRIAAADGSSQWITGAAARADGQHWRARASMIVTGAGTVRTDNPRLNVRLDQATRQPRRIILTRTFDVSPTAHIFATPGETIVYGPELSSLAVTTASAVKKNLDALLAAGHKLSCTPVRDQHSDSADLDLAALLDTWGAEGANELHVECGAHLAGQLIQQNLVDEVLLYLAPAFLGDQGHPLAYLPAVQSLPQALRYQLFDCQRLGGDVRFLLRHGEKECSVD